jgi:predicted Kef-type K+ transport protein
MPMQGAPPPILASTLPLAAAVPHETGLIVMIAVGFGLAFVLGLLATRLRLPPLVGYLLAGVAVGPFTPGFVADAGLASQLAEIGVILLMFGVGLHFSLGDLGGRELVLAIVRYAFSSFGLREDMARVAAETLQLADPETGRRTTAEAVREIQGDAP